MMGERSDGLLHLTRQLEKHERVHFGKRKVKLGAKLAAAAGVPVAKTGKKGKDGDEDEAYEGGIVAWLGTVVDMVRHAIRPLSNRQAAGIREPKDEHETFLLDMAAQSLIPGESGTDSKSYKALVTRWSTWAIDEVNEVVDFREEICSFASTFRLRMAVSDAYSVDEDYHFFDGFQEGMKDDEVMVPVVDRDSLAGKFDDTLRSLASGYERAVGTIWKLLRQEAVWKKKEEPDIGREECKRLLDVSSARFSVQTMGRYLLNRAVIWRSR